MRCAVRFFNYGLPYTVGYPLAKITVANGTLVVSCPVAAGRISVPLDAVTRAELESPNLIDEHSYLDGAGGSISGERQDKSIRLEGNQ